MKKISFLFLILISQTLFSQEERKTLFGMIYDKDGGVLENAHIVNFSNSNATFTDKNGEYRIFAKPTDTLRFTSIGYKTIFVKLTKKHFDTYRKRITLEKQDYELDEITIKNNQLYGDITKDLKKVKITAKEKAFKKNSNFNNVTIKNNYADNKLKLNLENTDPTRNFEGFGTTNTIPLRDSKKLWKLRKELAFKESMPANLLSELGEQFFFVELKIPVERYYHFLEYCNPLNIEKYYQDREVIKVINILRKEHKTYLQIIEKN